jgi:hypothetical protein
MSNPYRFFIPQDHGYWNQSEDPRDLTNVRVIETDPNYVKFFGEEVVNNYRYEVAGSLYQNEQQPREDLAAAARVQLQQFQDWAAAHPNADKIVVTEIIASASTSFTHPNESYANFKPGLTLKIAVQDGQDSCLLAGAAQLMVHAAVMREKERILAALEHEREVESIRSQIENDESDLDQFRQLAGKVRAELAEAEGVLAAEKAKHELEQDTIVMARAQDRIEHATENMRLHETAINTLAETLQEHRVQLAKLMGNLDTPLEPKANALGIRTQLDLPAAVEESELARIREIASSEPPLVQTC